MRNFVELKTEPENIQQLINSDSFCCLAVIVSAISPFSLGEVLKSYFENKLHCSNDLKIHGIKIIS